MKTLVLVKIFGGNINRLPFVAKREIRRCSNHLKKFYKYYQEIEDYGEDEAATPCCMINEPCPFEIDTYELTSKNKTDLRFVKEFVQDPEVLQLRKPLEISEIEADTLIEKIKIYKDYLLQKEAIIIRQHNGRKE